MGCPTDSGGGIQTTDLGESARNQAGAPKISTGFGETIDNPFVRKDALMRTPPRGRTSSMPDLGKPNKRKRTEDVNSTVSKGCKKEYLKGILDKISQQANQLEKILKDMYNPKKELRDVSGKLLLQVAKLQSEEMKEWLDETMDETKDQEIERGLRKEIYNLRTQSAHMETMHIKELENLRNRHTQCKSCLEEERKRARRKVLTKDVGYDAFKSITEDDWREQIFPKASLHQENIWESPSDCAWILPCDKNISSTFRPVTKLIERLGRKEYIMKQNKKKGDMALMIHSVSFPDETGSFVQNTRAIYYPIISDGGLNEGDEGDYILQSLIGVKNHMMQNDWAKLALPEVEGVDGLSLIRMIEYVFADTNIEIMMFRERDEIKKWGQLTRSRINSFQVNSDKTTRKKKPKQDALLVKVSNMEYAHLLKTVRQNINPTEIGVEVREIKKTRNGELLLTVQNGTEKLDALKKEIMDKIPEVTTSRLTSKKVVHIKDLDEVTTIEEVKEAISKAISVKPESVEVRALRPAHASRQSVTVVLAETDADKLIELGRLRIRWTKCRILERKTELKCYRCWEYGHTKTQCKGLNREQLCLKCGQEGHKAATCKNNAYCVYCNAEGHQSGSVKCPSYNGGGKQEAPRPISSNNN